MARQKKALGRGLSAILSNQSAEITSRKKMTTSSVVSSSMSDIAIGTIQINPFQPRTHFHQESLEELAKSIENCLPLLSENGVLVSTEPMVPTGDVDETDELKMALVNGFNDWIELIKKSQIEYYVAFIPVFEGTIVTFLKK